MAQEILERHPESTTTRWIYECLLWKDRCKDGDGKIKLI